MRRIFKYPIKPRFHQIVRIPCGYQILDFQYQGQQLVMWAEVVEGIEQPALELYIIGTGGEVPLEKVDGYLKTVQHKGMVWHIYKGNHS